MKTVITLEGYEEVFKVLTQKNNYPDLSGDIEIYFDAMIIQSIKNGVEFSLSRNDVNKLLEAVFKRAGISCTVKRPKGFS